MSASSLTQTPTLPAGLAVGDILILVAGNRSLGAPKDAITIPGGWDLVLDEINSNVLIGGQNHLVIAWRRVDDVIREVAPVVGFSTFITNMSQVIAVRGVDNIVPIAEFTVSSSTAGAAPHTIGPITGLTVAAGNAALVVGQLSDNFFDPGIDTLTGDGLTWAELVEASTTLGSDAGYVIDMAINDTGSPVAVSAKTFVVNGDNGLHSIGSMLELVAAAPTSADFRTFRYWEADRVKETTATTGTGRVTLAGAVDKYGPFSTFAVMDLFPYVIADAATGDYEKGIGRKDTTTTLERITVLASSNADGFVNFGAGTKTVVVPDSASDEIANMLQRVGDGHDGDVTVSGALSLDRDMYYRTLTLAAGAAIVTNGFFVHAHYIDASQAPLGAIQWNGIVGGAGGDAVGATPGAAGIGAALLTSKCLGGNAVVGGNGAIGLIGAAGSGTPTAVTVTALCNGGRGGGGGRGGRGEATSQTVAATSATITLKHFPRHGLSFLRGVSLLLGGSAGAGGSAGRGNAVVAGGGGGGGASGPGVVVVKCLVLRRGASTAAGAISARGGVGGMGGAPALGASRTGGGGGGGGSGGGYVFLDVGVLAGTTATNMINASGGDGGAGHDGLDPAVVGGPTGGEGGNGGGAGSVFVRVGGIMVFESASDLVTAGAVGATVTGVTASPGGAGAALLVNV